METKPLLIAGQRISWSAPGLPGVIAQSTRYGVVGTVDKYGNAYVQDDDGHTTYVLASTATVVLFLRDDEHLLKIISTDAGECTVSNKPLTRAMFGWGHRITTNRTGPFRIGEDPFPCNRHTDGTHCTDGTGRPVSSCYAKPVCPKCGAVDRFQRVQEAYGDRVTCVPCGDENWYSIGD